MSRLRYDLANVRIDQIIGAGLERITINLEDPQVAFDDVAQTLTEEAQPVIEAIAALG